MVGNWVVEKFIIDSTEYQSNLLSNMIILRNDNSFECSEILQDTNSIGSYSFIEKDSILLIETKNKFFSDKYSVSIKGYDELQYVKYVELKSKGKYMLLGKMPPRSL